VEQKESYFWWNNVLVQLYPVSQWSNRAFPNKLASAENNHLVKHSGCSVIKMEDTFRSGSGSSILSHCHTKRCFSILQLDYLTANNLPTKRIKVDFRPAEVELMTSIFAEKGGNAWKM